jgi:hypothetical protein
MPLFELVLRQDGLADETRIADHKGFAVGEVVTIGEKEWRVASAEASDRSAASSRPVARIICVRLPDGRA